MRRRSRRAAGRTGCSAITTGRALRAASASARPAVAAMLLLTLRGTPTVYYGDEIGMPQVDIPPDRVRDPFEKNVPGIGVGRDGCRTPMQWDATRQRRIFGGGAMAAARARAGESTNVENLRADKTSIYNLYRRLIAARKQHPALARGDYHPNVTGKRFPDLHARGGRPARAGRAQSHRLPAAPSVSREDMLAAPFWCRCSATAMAKRSKTPSRYAAMRAW